MRLSYIPMLIKLPPDIDFFSFVKMEKLESVALLSAIYEPTLEKKNTAFTSYAN